MAVTGETRVYRGGAWKRRGRPDIAPGFEAVPGGIDATGATDAAADLNSWLTTLADGVVADLGGGTFRCETPVTVANKTDFTFRNGTLIRTDATGHGGMVYPTPNPHLHFADTTRCRIENIVINGTNTTPDPDAANDPRYGQYEATYEFEAAVKAENFTDIEIFNLTSDGVWGDHIQFHHGSRFLVDGLTGLRNGRQGIGMLGDNGTIRNSIIDSRRAGIDMEPDLAAQTFTDVLIDNCRIHSWLVAFGSFGPGNFNDIEIRHCDVTHSTGLIVNADSSSIPGGRRDRWWVHHNKFGTALPGGWQPSGSGPVIKLHNSVDNIVENNHIWHYALAAARISVGLAEAGTATVRNNWFQNSQQTVQDADGTCTWTDTNNTTGAAPPVTDWDPVIGYQG